MRAVAVLCCVLPPCLLALRALIGCRLVDRRGWVKSEHPVEKARLDREAARFDLNCDALAKGDTRCVLCAVLCGALAVPVWCLCDALCTV